MVSLYELLEVSPNASAAVIKAAYRCLAQQYHPDKNSGDRVAEARLCLINQAYSVLSDPLQRALHNQEAGFGTAGERRGSGRPLAPARSEQGDKGEVRVRPFRFRAVA